MLLTNVTTINLVLEKKIGPGDWLGEVIDQRERKKFKQEIWIGGDTTSWVKEYRLLLKAINFLFSMWALSASQSSKLLLPT